MKHKPDFSIESEYDGIIVALDEVGRGPLAGPVLAAAAILDRSFIPDGINDSKLLTAPKRAELFDAICATARVAVGIASVQEIEEINILQASKLAMCRAYESLGVKADIALVDGNQPPGLPCRTRCVVQGDSLSLSIAAASIVAKVTRDRMMIELARQHPGYGWETNMGYGTREHYDALGRLGVTPHHRRTFAPIRALLEMQAANSEPLADMELL